MKNFIFYRDFIAFALLLVVCKTAIDLRNPTINNDITPSASTHPHTVACIEPELTQEPTIALHEPAAAVIETVETVEKAEVKREPFVAQDIEQSIEKQIECAQTQIRKALDIAKSTSVEAAQLYSLLQKLSLLQTEYKTSLPQEPAGPLKAAAVALEEDDIRKELLSTIHKFAAILHTLAGGVHEPDNSIVKELETNHNILDKLILA